MTFNYRPLTLALAVLMQPSLGMAQQFELEEIVVTAQKRAQSTQDVPLAISAFNGEDLKAMGAVDSSSIVARTPGMNGGKDSDTQSVISIRGIGTSAFSPGTDNSVGTYYNEVPVSRTIGGHGFLDVERIEVVKGPQGTLFGRNTSSGAISVTNNAAELEADNLDVTLGVGTESYSMVEIVANKSLGDNAAIRFAGKHDERDGTYSDVDGTELNNRDHDQYRVSLQWNPTDTLNVKWFYERFESDTDWGPVARDQAFNSKVDIEVPPSGFVESDLAVLNIGVDLGEDYTLTAITGYYDNETRFSADIDAAEAGEGFDIGELAELWDMEQFSQDFRINYSGDRFDWFVGASYYNEKVSVGSFAELRGLDIGFGPFPDENGFGSNETDSVAVYGDLIYRPTDELTLTLGARYTREEKDARVDNAGIVVFPAQATGQPLQASEDWTSFDPRFAIDYALNENTLIYFNFAQGFKSGGFNRQPNALLTGVDAVDPEENNAYEIGIKADLLENRARINAAYFFYDYTDFQSEVQDGFVDDPASGVPVSLKGNDGLRSPESSWSLAATHSYPMAQGELVSRLEYTYTDDMFYTVTNDLQAEDYGLLNLRLAYVSGDDTWSLALIGENLTDEEYESSVVALFDALSVPGMKRTVRAEVRYSFF
jgi:iron complex outermembrane receptor protein